MAESAARTTARKLLRRFVRDYPELNRLLRAQEHTPEDLDLALDLTVAEYNAKNPPLSPVDIDSYPNLWLLLHGGAVHLIRSAGILQARNRLPYSSGGISVRMFDKTELYMQWVREFIQDYNHTLVDSKIAANIQSGWGGIHSAYWPTGWWTTTE